MTHYQPLDIDGLLARVAERIPADLRPNVVVIGSIATAWAYRDVLGSGTVATKDIDLLLHPAFSAVATAASLERRFTDEGWCPRVSADRPPGTAATPDEALPVLRLEPPGGHEGWYVELLAVPLGRQTARRTWHRFVTSMGHFGLPSFRYMPVAVADPDHSPFGLLIARGANMALAHLLEHADPDLTEVSTLAGRPPRFVKDVGRAVSLWWLANQQSVSAAADWHETWTRTVATVYPDSKDSLKQTARHGLSQLSAYLHDAHRVATTGVLSPHGTSPEAFGRAYQRLRELIEQW